MSKRLYRSRHNRIFAGVLGGVGEYFDIDSAIIRILFVVLLLVTGIFPFVVLYIIMAILVPLEGRSYQEPRRTAAEGVEDLKETATELGRDIRDAFRSSPESPASQEDVRRRRRYLIGLIIILIGIIILISNLGGFSWWRYAWPVILIIIGLVIILAVARK